VTERRVRVADESSLSAGVNEDFALSAVDVAVDDEEFGKLCVLLRMVGVELVFLWFDECF